VIAHAGFFGALAIGLLIVTGAIARHGHEPGQRDLWTGTIAVGIIGAGCCAAIAYGAAAA
jgi:hypothetical protein